MRTFGCVCPPTAGCAARSAGASRRASVQALAARLITRGDIAISFIARIIARGSQKRPRLTLHDGWKPRGEEGENWVNEATNGILQPGARLERRPAGSQLNV